ncbi:1-(5-phosphoribosyl)-5-[(5-phosphoribosylamino)methylideneamino]imidazole-4-carboxamide isomerase [Ferruginibacter lapsinanis]|uniref:1-(5-phosphoribosyl)-5-[(5- phosphoribosylamino)methylideneamino]imidazole-4- carboxamide isomerase n=1 Tax=Ferruginibacter lapsinanis TaxID=563172 RepID=UPI001E2AF794|nr:1-(5-phosphoribosyl)-5-[(5-phosphoribosylamino)methylideneamino]imidazole-4-carboxamide isomerase [Ferruginibacter lapsinanis]UEG49774.1 1-(5-phosphoribosyl)-5-[(5-phosphoribosylamino)methylideneamino]imidazole-4-carboxamide isomerase [Ferruginibacter lapsinanis]
MEIIPAIDIIDGKCVRLTKGDYAQKKIYNENPAEVAREFEAAGIKRLHVVDLDGAKAGKIVNLKVLESIAEATDLIIDFGGGVKTISDVSDILNAGGDIVTIGSLAVKQPQVIEEWLMEFGTDKFLIGADVLDEKIKIGGWLEDSGLNIYDFIGKLLSLGATHIFCTDISKDGVMEGPSIDLYKKIMEQHPEINLIASGGVSNFDDVLQLKEIGCGGAIIGKAIYEGKITLKQLATIN